MRSLTARHPAARRVKYDKHRDRNIVRGSQAVEASQAKICCPYFERRTMDDVEEHRNLPEHVKHAVLPETDAQLEPSEQRETR